MNSIATICTFHGATGWKDPQDEISIVFYLQTVGSQEAQKILPARGTTCISSQLCTIITMVSFAFYYFRTPLKLVLNSFESIFSRNTYTFIYFYLVFNLKLVGSQGADKILQARGTACILSGLCLPQPVVKILQVRGTLYVQGEFSSFHLPLDLWKKPF